MNLTRAITRAITQSLTQSLTSPPIGGGGAAVWVPDATFFAGASGFAYNPFDYSKAFQDSAGATPVTATGQSLGRLTDLSGNGNHRTQATSGKKPLTAAGGYTFDNFDDGMTGPCNTSSAGAWTYLAKIGAGADTVGIIMRGNSPGSSYFGYYSSGGVASSYGGNVTQTSMKVDGVTVTNSNGALYTALTGSPHLLELRISAFVHAGGWDSVFNIGDYSGFVAGITVGREILIQRNLTGDDLANAIAWVNI